MAKVQIFVLVIALSQVYGNVVISTLPAFIAPETRPEPLPEIEVVPDVPQIITPPCVSTIRALLEAILQKLPDIQAPAPAPLPVEPEQEEVETPELPPVLPPVAETPCSACFEHINSLLTSAEKVLAVRRMATMLRM